VEVLSYPHLKSNPEEGVTTFQEKLSNSTRILGTSEEEMRSLLIMNCSLCSMYKDVIKQNKG
jgi:hypothetical protein